MAAGAQGYLVEPVHPDDHAFGRKVGITLEIAEVENHARAVVG